MEATDIFLQELTVDGADKQPENTKLQRKLFKATRRGDLEKIKRLIQLKCEINCVSNSGKALLQVAAELGDACKRNEVITALLNGGADLEFGILHAIRDTNVKVVQTLLSFYSSAPPTSPRPRTSLTCQGHITPLILAAWLDNFQIVKLLLDRGFTISDPEWPAGDSSRKDGEKLGPAVYRLNRYRALASPVYIALTFLQNVQGGPDPVHRACVLNKELRDTADQEYEFRKEYLELSDGCKEFAVALLNECRSMKEIRCVMEMTNKRTDMLLNMQGKCLNILELAIATRNEKFVCHPYSQLALNSEVYKSVPYLEKSSLKQAGLLLLASVMFPLLFMVWLVSDLYCPNHKLSRMFHSPCVKFLITCGSYQTFLFFLAFTAFHSSQSSEFLEYSIVDWLVLFFVIGLLVEVIKDVYQQGKDRFCSDHWNYLAVALVTSFAIHYSVWWAGRALLAEKVDTMEWETHTRDGYGVILASYCFFAVGILLSFTRNLSFIQANSITGPLLHAFTQMLVDVARFFLYFVFVFLAFAVSFTKLYLQYDKARRHFHVNIASPNQTTDPLNLERFGNSMKTIFWSLFGEVDDSGFQIEEDGYGAIWKTGMVFFGAFNIVAVLVALNMLIAILNESYTRISEDLDTEWKFTRTKLWLSWIYKKGVLPPPLNILYVFLPVRWVVVSVFTKFHTQEAAEFFSHTSLNRKPKPGCRRSKIDEKERREVIRNLVLRYLAKKSCHSETETESSDSEEENEAAMSLTNNNPINGT